ncbi:MAG: SpoIIE family protein phosphatase [Chloroflexota bacterium]
MMETNLVNDIRKGLTDTRLNLEQWNETASAEDRQTCLGVEGESCLQAHLHVVDTSLEKLESGTLGICEVCHGRVDESLLRMDYTSCICLDHYSPQERRELETELELSQEVQRALLPQRVPSIRGVEVAAFSRPAQIVSGDYFDFLQFKDGAHGLVIADVSGHGVAAGMLMTSLQTAFHTLVPETDSPVDVLKRLNRLYVHNINFSTFVTVLFARLDPVTRILDYANAGHNPALHYRPAAGQTTWLSPTGAAIGLMEAFTVQRKSIQLEPGDTLLFYTDGVTEAANARGEFFDRERLEEIVRRNAQTPAEGLIRELLQGLNGFTNGRPLLDDVTLVVFKVK